MRFHRLIASALPLLASVASTLAWVSQLDSDELVSRYADHSDALLSRFADYDDELSARDDGFGIDNEYDLRDLSDHELRSLSDYLSDYLEARAKGAPYPVKQAKPKLTKNKQKARKDAVRKDVKTRQTNNAAKKKDLQQKAKTERKYGKPRSAKNQKPNQPGYRAAGRKIPHGQPGSRLPKQPKTPKPNMKKGDPRSAKSQTRQAAANQRTKDRKAAGRTKFADARKEYKKTTNLPNRKTKFTTKDGTVTGKDARTAVFNSHHFKGNTGTNPAPKVFNNHPQGPRHKKEKPIGNMKGSGHEFPVNNKKGGYQGGGDVGTTRVITQPKRNGGTKFMGVVGHDSSRKVGDPGYNDHIQVKAKPGRK